MMNPTEEQKLAIEKEGMNIIVSAGAGSGKTAVLTERVIQKLKKGVNIDSLLILTFTNAAASEMKERIRNAIRNNGLYDQLLKIDSSYITTFDSFALSIVKKYHYLLNIDDDIKISDDLVLKFKKQEILDNIFNKLYEKEDCKFLKFIGDFTRKDDIVLKHMILDIDNKLDLRYDKEEYLNNYFNVYYNNTFIDKKIEEYLNLLKRKQEKIQENLDEIELIVDGDYYFEISEMLKPLLDSQNYEDIKNNLDISLPRLKKGMTNAKPYKEKIGKLLKELRILTTYDSIAEIKASIFKTQDYVEIIIFIIQELNNHFAKFKQDNKLYNFLDIAKLAIKLVLDFKEVKEELKNSFSEILLDEYQDTSDLQEMLIGKISNNNVYMVGDIKQSIYRFRNANPNLFKEKYLNYEKGVGGFKIDLLKNFRSREEVLSNINLLFDDIMNIEIGGADYKKSHRMVFANQVYNDYKETNQNYNFEIYNYNLDNKEYSSEEVEAFITVLDIKNKINNHFQVYDKKLKCLRDVNYDDFLILMDKSKNFDLYKKIFEYHNVNLTIVKNENIANSYDLLILKNIFILLKKYKEKNFDKTFWYCFLSIGRSYLFSLDDNYLYQKITNKDIANNIILEKIKKITEDIDVLPLAKIINNIIMEFNFYEKLITVGNIEESLIRLDYLENLSNNLGNISYTYIDFIDYLNKLIDNKEKIEIPLNKDIKNTVKIMTIHESKGLESSICYYPGLSSKFNISDMLKRFFYDEKFGIVTPYVDRGIRQTFYTTLYRDHFIREEIGERIRLFYVALTRAKEKMIIITSLKEEEETEEISLDTKLKYTSFASILNSISYKLTPYIKQVDISKIPFTKEYTMNKKWNILDNISKDKPIFVEELNIKTKEKTLNHYSKNIYSLITKEEKDILELGTKLHRIFEIVDFKVKDFSLIEPKYHKYLNTFLKTDFVADIDKAKIYKEYEFIYEKDNITYHGVIDLMLEYSDHIDIIDYKLKNTDDIYYEKQLKGYEEFIKTKTEKKINLYLYSLTSGTYKKI